MPTTDQTPITDIAPRPRKRTRRPPVKKEEPGVVGTLLKITLIIAGIIAIYFLYTSSPPEKTLVCNNSNRMGSLIGFGSCTTE